MNRLLTGTIAGAAGTLALDVATYVDMAVRRRASSNVPAEVVRRAAEEAGMTALATPDDRADEKTKHQRSALGALSGYAIGLTIGAAYGAASPLVQWMPRTMTGVLLGALAMAASDIPATALGATDPQTWGTQGWIGDIVPHAVYGLTVAAVYDAIASQSA